MFFEVSPAILRYSKQAKVYSWPITYVIQLKKVFT